MPVDPDITVTDAVRGVKKTSFRRQFNQSVSLFWLIGLLLAGVWLVVFLAGGLDQFEEIWIVLTFVTIRRAGQADLKITPTATNKRRDRIPEIVMPPIGPLACL